MFVTVVCFAAITVASILVAGFAVGYARDAQEVSVANEERSELIFKQYIDVCHDLVDKEAELARVVEKTSTLTRQLKTLTACIQVSK